MARQDELDSGLVAEEYSYIEQTMLSAPGNPVPTLQNTFPIRDGSGNPFRTGRCDNATLPNASRPKRPCDKANVDSATTSSRD